MEALRTRYYFIVNYDRCSKIVWLVCMPFVHDFMTFFHLCFILSSSLFLKSWKKMEVSNIISFLFQFDTRKEADVFCNFIFFFFLSFSLETMEVLITKLVSTSGSSISPKDDQKKNENKINALLLLSWNFGRRIGASNMIPFLFQFDTRK